MQRLFSLYSGEKNSSSVSFFGGAGGVCVGLVADALGTGKPITGGGGGGTDVTVTRDTGGA